MAPLDIVMPGVRTGPVNPWLLTVALLFIAAAVGAALYSFKNRGRQ